MHPIMNLAQRLRDRAAAGESAACLRLLGEMSALVKAGAVVEGGVMDEFYACMRLVARWYPQVWPAALEISRAVHTARPDAATATWFIEALRMNGQHEAAHDIAFESVHRFEVTPGLLLETAAAYLAAGHEDAARQFLAAGVENGHDLAATIEREPTLQALQPLL
jgi:hypothetical protein